MDVDILYRIPVLGSIIIALDNWVGEDEEVGVVIGETKMGKPRFVYYSPDYNENEMEFLPESIIGYSMEKTYAKKRFVIISSIEELRFYMERYQDINGEPFGESPLDEQLTAIQEVVESFQE